MADRKGQGKWRNGTTSRRDHKTADSTSIQLGEKAANEDTRRNKDKTERLVLQAARQIIMYSFLRNSVTTKSTFFPLDLDQCITM